MLRNGDLFGPIQAFVKFSLYFNGKSNPLRIGILIARVPYLIAFWSIFEPGYKDIIRNNDLIRIIEVFSKKGSWNASYQRCFRPVDQLAMSSALVLDITITCALATRSADSVKISTSFPFPSSYTTKLVSDSRPRCQFTRLHPIAIQERLLHPLLMKCSRVGDLI
jgi:hypothetical protein